MRLVGKPKAAQLSFLKRHGNLFEKIISMENLELAYLKARRGKSWQKNVQNFEKDVLGNLAKIQDVLKNRTYHTSTYQTKKVFEPKERTIYVLPFYPDRLIQHAIMNVLEPIWDKLFIHDSYACRKNKGTHAGSLRAMEFIRKNDYCLQCDVSKFYPSINHDVLFRIVQRKIKCPDTLWLLRDIIYSYSGESNVPIGNYTSQWFGNLYLNELDQLIKQKYGIRCYVRYCDDFLLFHNDKKVLREMARVVTEYVGETLKMRLSKCNLFPVSHGVDFLGYRHFRGYILLRKSTTKRVMKRMKRLPYDLKHHNITPEQLRSSIASTRGWLQWANTHNLQIKLKLDELEMLVDEEIQRVCP